MKRKRVGKFHRQGSLYSPEEVPGRTPARKRSGAPRAIEIEEQDVIAEYELADFEALEVPEYEAIEIEN